MAKLLCHEKAKTPVHFSKSKITVTHHQCLRYIVHVQVLQRPDTIFDLPVAFSGF